MAIGEAVVALREEAKYHDRAAVVLQKDQNTLGASASERGRASYLRGIANRIMKKADEGKIKETQ